MGLKLSFELSDRDLHYFRESLKQSREAVRDAEEQEIVERLEEMTDETRLPSGEELIGENQHELLHHTHPDGHAGSSSTV